MEASLLPHAAFVHRRVMPLRFPTALEAEFRRYYWDRLLWRTRWLTGIMLVGFLLFALADSQRPEASTREVRLAIRLGLVAPALALTLLIAARRAWLRWLEPALSLGMLLALLGQAALIIVSRYDPTPVPTQSFSLVLMIVYLVSGLRFRRAAVIGIAASLWLLLALPQTGEPRSLTIYYLVMFNVVGLTGLFSLEMLLRRNFISTALAEFRALRDPLTMLHNRRAVMAHLDRVQKQSRREQRPYAVLMIDVDHFKLYNDEYGHVAGDACLQKVASALDQVLQRPFDMVARYGGEEFIAVAFDHAGDLFRLAERLRTAVSDLNLAHGAEGAGPRVTVSVGAADTLQPASLEGDFERLIDAADRALYRAKRAGRDRSELARPADFH
ncbi:MAG TPA: GGDEF domain-containing protein [Nevskiaceae bacterium]|nr:GGDEF domain-containing protein [Nevskiaceae bacterium]